jgi:transposase-like protein
MAKATRRRKSYSDAQRKTILDTAQREGLTAMDVKKRFGVTPVTYYSWRKKTGAAAARRGRRAVAYVAAGGNGNLSNSLVNEVRARIQQVLPAIVRSEVSSYMETLFAGSTGGVRRRRRGRPPGRRKVTVA